VFGNDGMFNLGTKIILQQVEHGRALLLYTLMPDEDSPQLTRRAVTGLIRNSKAQRPSR
jgi:hypothetical protein